MMQHHRRRFNFYHGLAVSLALHAALALPFVLGLHPSAKPERSKLRIELFGMIADRQTEAKRMRQEPSPPQPRQVNRSRPRKIPDTYRTVATESPVAVAKPEKEPKPAEQEPQPPPSAAVPTVAANDAVQQKQQTIRPVAEQESDRIRRYLGLLAKQLRGNVVYPESVRKHGIEGISTIAFVVMENGSIKGGTLRVKKSSGYADLDASALNAARTRAPFEKPPKELGVSIDVVFTVKMARQSFASAPAGTTGS